jgi:hypothetical protein
MVDVIIHILQSPFLVVCVMLIVAAFIVSVALGFVEVSWSGDGLKLSQGEMGRESTDLSIGGTWYADGRDLNDSDGSLAPHFTYRLNLTFTQKKGRVKLQGTYRVNEHPELPERSLDGKGEVHGNYISLLYRIRTGDPPTATTHGTLLIHVHPDAHTGEGYFIARSMANDGFVFGSLVCTR